MEKQYFVAGGMFGEGDAQSFGLVCPGNGDDTPYVGADVEQLWHLTAKHASVYRYDRTKYLTRVRKGLPGCAESPMVVKMPAHIRLSIENVIRDGEKAEAK